MCFWGGRTEPQRPAADRKLLYQRTNGSFPAGRLACTCGPAPAPPPTCLGGRGGEVGRTGERRKEGRRRPLGAGSIGWAGGVSGPLRAAPEEVPGPGGSALSPSWSCWAGTVRVAVGGLCAQCRPRCLRPGPMALVTVSRSPPASGHSTPVEPAVSLTLLWSCPHSWLPAGPGGSASCPGAAAQQAWGCVEGAPKAQARGGWGSLDAKELGLRQDPAP